MKRWILTLIVLIGLTANIAAATEYDGRFLLREITFTLKEDGSWIRDYHHVFRFNSHFATRRMGETFILFNPEFQTLGPIHSVTTMKDGKRVMLPENALNPVLPRAAHNQPGFSHLREMVVTHTGLERGCQVELNYRITTKPGFSPGFFARENLAERLPIDQLRIRVIAEGKRKLYFASTNELMPEISESTGQRTWTWSLKNISALVRENAMMASKNPVIFLGENNDWKSVFSGVVDAGDLPEAAARELSKCTEHTLSDVERLIKVSQWMDQAVDFSPVTIELTGWKCRTLAEIYRIHTATALERALLGFAALKQSGLKPRLLALSQGWLDAEGPVIAQLGGFLLEVETGRKNRYYLDPSGHMKGLIPLQHAGEPVYDVTGDSFRSIDTLEAMDHGVEISGKIKIKEKKPSGYIEINVSGGFVDYRSALKEPEGFISRFAREIIPFGQYEVEGIKEMTPEIIRARLKVKDVTGKKFSNGFTSFPQPEVRTLTRRHISLEKRVTTLKLAHPFRILVTLDVECDDSYLMEYTRPDIDMHCGNAHFVHRVSPKKEGVTRMEWSLVVPADTVNPESYNRFRQIVSQALSPADWWIVSRDSKQ